MTDNLIVSDDPFDDAQRQVLTAVLDTLLPPSDDGAMPGAGSLDFIGYLRQSGGSFVAELEDIIGLLGERFVDLPASERHDVVDAFSRDHPAQFEGLLFQVYAAYYQDLRVLEGIGSAAGPPFPRGNTVEAGDLSLLDPVVRGNRTYRK